MGKKTYICGQSVIVRRLGDDGEYRARVCGIADDQPECIFYILEMIDKIPGFNDEWTHRVIIDSCIDEK